MIRVIRDAYRRAMTGAHLLVDVALGEREEAARRHHLVAAHYDRAVVEGRLGVEDALEQ